MNGRVDIRHKVSILYLKYHDLKWWVIRKVWSILPNFLKKPIKKLKNLWEMRLLRSQQEVLSALLSQNQATHPIIVFAPSLDWNVQLFQRPQQLALAFARQGALVFYPQPKPNFKLAPFQEIAERLYLCNVIIETFDILQSPIVYSLTWNSDYIRRFESPLVLYDYVDDIDVFYGDREQIIRGHEILVREAKLLVVTADRLYRAILTIRPDAIFCPNGVEYERFTGARTNEGHDCPVDLAPILAKEKPIIGYYGALARWFDYALLAKVAEARPGYSFILIGPDYDGTVRSQPVFQLPNVYWLGVKPYAELPTYLHYFDVATIPFIVSEITHATSPLKLFEYMAGGKPVVVTPMHESMRYPGVLVGKDPEEFAVKLDEALSLKSDASYLSMIDDVARANTWDRRAEQILAALEDKQSPALD